MAIDFIELAKSIGKEYTSNTISNFIKEIEERIRDMNSEKNYTIDRFEGEFAVCEDRDTKEIVNIKKSELPQGIMEGSILKYVDNKYEINIEEELETSERIAQKMNNLWKN